MSGEGAARNGINANLREHLRAEAEKASSAIRQVLLRHADLCASRSPSLEYLTPLEDSFVEGLDQYRHVAQQATGVWIFANVLKHGQLEAGGDCDDDEGVDDLPAFSHHEETQEVVLQVMYKFDVLHKERLRGREDQALDLDIPEMLQQGYEREVHWPKAPYSSLELTEIRLAAGYV